jgi:crossover junction endodeoxyribonuclease RusA
MIFTLPFPPTVNTLYPSGKTGRRFLSVKGKAYKAEVYARVLEQHGLFKPLTGPLSVTVEHFPPDKRKRDHDNYCKALWDSLGEAGVFMDDSQIKEAHYYMREPGSEPKTIVILEEL